MLVVEALVMLASVLKSVVTVPTVVEEVLKTDWPETASAVAEAFCSDVFPVAVKRETVVVARVEVPVTVKVLVTVALVAVKLVGKKLVV